MNRMTSRWRSSPRKSSAQPSDAFNAAPALRSTKVIINA